MSSLTLMNGIYYPETETFVPHSQKLDVMYREYKGDETEVLFVKEYFKKLIPDEDVREYMLNILSDVLFKPVSSGKVYIWKGDGNNGKTTLCSLMNRLLGTFSRRLQCDGHGWDKDTLFAYMDLHDVRTEPAVLKELVGSDPILVKALSKEPELVSHKFKMNILTNGRDMKWNDGAGLWSCIRVIPFESTFHNEEFVPSHKDFNCIDYSKYFVAMVGPLIWILVEQFKKNSGGCYSVPERIILETIMYQQEQMKVKSH